MTEDRASGRSGAGGLTVCWMTDIGCLRKNNEDACLAAPETGLLAVADGMGGELAGEVASRLTVQWLPDLMDQHAASGGTEGEVEQGIQDALMELNHRLRSQASSLSEVRKMGATIVLVQFRGKVAYVANVGDSRGYLHRSGELWRLTTDHSVVGTLLSRGAITREQAACHPMRGQLSRYLGMGGEARADVSSVELVEGDRLLLCSDGLTNEIGDEEIGDILDAKSPAKACRHLVGAARETGGRDNITVLIADWTSERAG